MTNIVLQAYDYLDELRMDANYLKLIKLNKLINEKPTKEFIEYVKIKNEYEAVMEYGRFHPDFKEVSKKFSVAKSQIYQTKLIKEYLKLSKLIEAKVTKLCNEMAKAISKNIPIENELGLFSIGGTCSGCK